MKFTIENLEFYLLVLVRVSAFVMAAPFFSYNTISNLMKASISIVLSAVISMLIPVTALSYEGVIGFSVLVVKEAMAGVVLGYFCRMCFYIVNFAGQLIDMEIGLAMASMYDPTTNVQITVTGNIYNYLMMLLLVVTNMHYYIIRAIVDSFTYFNVGKEVFREGLYDLALKFIANFFVIAVRIVLPMMCCMMLVNVILGVLARAAPQMNMFVVGIQIKVIVGIIVLVLLIQTVPTVADFIFTEMKDVASDVLRILSP